MDDRGSRYPRRIQTSAGGSMMWCFWAHRHSRGHTDFLNPNPELNGDAEVSWGGFLIPVLWWTLSLSLSLSLSHQWIKVGIKEREEYEISIKSHLALRWLKITYLSYTCHDCLLFKKHTVLFSFLKVFLNFFYFKLLFFIFLYSNIKN